MNSVEAAFATQLANIEKRTGRSLTELVELVRTSGLTKHGQVRDMLKRDLGLGHGDANTLAHHALGTGSFGAAVGAQSPLDDVEAGLYAGARAALRPIHDRLMAAIRTFGPFEVAPKKAYVSLRRRKQFAMVGPATNTRVEVGINLPGLAPSERLQAMPPKSMCDYKVRLGDVAEVDEALLGWLRQAYENAG